MSYNVHMRTTITIRTEESLRRELEERAASAGESLSETVRRILLDAVAERPLGERVGHLRGTLDLSRRPAEPWRERLRERNWRP